MKKILVLLVILVLAGAGYYFWKENNKVKKTIFQKTPLINEQKVEEKPEVVGKGFPQGGLTEVEEELEEMPTEEDDIVN